MNATPADDLPTTRADEMTADETTSALRREFDPVRIWLAERERKRAAAAKRAADSPLYRRTRVRYTLAYRDEDDEEWRECRERLWQCLRERPDWAPISLAEWRRDHPDQTPISLADIALIKRAEGRDRVEDINASGIVTIWRTGRVERGVRQKLVYTITPAAKREPGATSPSFSADWCPLGTRDLIDLAARLRISLDTIIGRVFGHPERRIFAFRRAEGGDLEYRVRPLDEWRHSYGY